MDHGPLGIPSQRGTERFQARKLSVAAGQPKRPGNPPEPPLKAGAQPVSRGMVALGKILEPLKHVPTLPVVDHSGLFKPKFPPPTKGHDLRMGVREDDDRTLSGVSSTTDSVLGDTFPDETASLRAHIGSTRPSSAPTGKARIDRALERTFELDAPQLVRPCSAGAATREPTPISFSSADIVFDSEDTDVEDAKEGTSSTGGAIELDLDAVTKKLSDLAFVTRHGFQVGADDPETVRQTTNILTRLGQAQASRKASTETTDSAGSGTSALRDAIVRCDKKGILDKVATQMGCDKTSVLDQIASFMSDQGMLDASGSPLPVNPTGRVTPPQLTLPSGEEISGMLKMQLGDLIKMVCNDTSTPTSTASATSRPLHETVDASYLGALLSAGIPTTDHEATLQSLVSRGLITVSGGDLDVRQPAPPTFSQADSDYTLGRGLQFYTQKLKSVQVLETANRDAGIDMPDINSVKAFLYRQLSEIATVLCDRIDRATQVPASVEQSDLAVVRQRFLNGLATLQLLQETLLSPDLIPPAGSRKESGIDKFSDFQKSVRIVQSWTNTRGQSTFLERLGRLNNATIELSAMDSEIQEDAPDAARQAKALLAQLNVAQNNCVAMVGFGEDLSSRFEPLAPAESAKKIMSGLTTTSGSSFDPTRMHNLIEGCIEIGVLRVDGTINKPTQFKVGLETRLPTRFQTTDGRPTPAEIMALNKYIAANPSFSAAEHQQLKGGGIVVAGTLSEACTSQVDSLNAKLTGAISHGRSMVTQYVLDCLETAATALSDPMQFLKLDVFTAGHAVSPQDRAAAFVLHETMTKFRIDPQQLLRQTLDIIFGGLDPRQMQQVCDCIQPTQTGKPLSKETASTLTSRFDLGAANARVKAACESVLTSIRSVSSPDELMALPALALHPNFTQVFDAKRVSVLSVTSDRTAVMEQFRQLPTDLFPIPSSTAAKTATPPALPFRGKPDPMRALLEKEAALAEALERASLEISNPETRLKLAEPLVAHLSGSQRVTALASLTDADILTFQETQASLALAPELDAAVKSAEATERGLREALVRTEIPELEAFTSAGQKAIVSPSSGEERLTRVETCLLTLQSASPEATIVFSRFCQERAQIFQTKGTDIAEKGAQSAKLQLLNARFEKEMEKMDDSVAIRSTFHQLNVTVSELEKLGMDTRQLVNTTGYHPEHVETGLHTVAQLRVKLGFLPLEMFSSTARREICSASKGPEFRESLEDILETLHDASEHTVACFTQLSSELSALRLSQKGVTLAPERVDTLQRTVTEKYVESQYRSSTEYRTLLQQLGNLGVEIEDQDIGSQQLEIQFKLMLLSDTEEGKDAKSLLTQLQEANAATLSSIDDLHEALSSMTSAVEILEEMGLKRAVLIDKKGCHFDVIPSILETVGKLPYVSPAIEELQTQQATLQEYRQRLAGTAKSSGKRREALSAIERQSKKADALSNVEGAKRKIQQQWNQLVVDGRTPTEAEIDAFVRNTTKRLLAAKLPLPYTVEDLADLVNITDISLQEKVLQRFEKSGDDPVETLLTAAKFERELGASTAVRMEESPLELSDVAPDGPMVSLKKFTQARAELKAVETEKAKLEKQLQILKTKFEGLQETRAREVVAPLRRPTLKTETERVKALMDNFNLHLTRAQKNLIAHHYRSLPIKPGIQPLSKRLESPSEPIDDALIGVPGAKNLDDFLNALNRAGLQESQIRGVELILGLTT